MIWIELHNLSIMQEVHLGWNGASWAIYFPISSCCILYFWTFQWFHYSTKKVKVECHHQNTGIDFDTWGVDDLIEGSAAQEPPFSALHNLTHRQRGFRRNALTNGCVTRVTAQCKCWWAEVKHAASETMRGGHVLFTVCSVNTQWPPAVTTTFAQCQHPDMHVIVNCFYYVDRCA